MGAKATLDALKDVGAALKDIQLLVCGQLFGTSGAGQRMLKEIGQTGIPVVNTANACATGSTAFREGYFAIASEMYDAVLVVGQEKGRQRVDVERLIPATFVAMPLDHLVAGKVHVDESTVRLDHAVLQPGGNAKFCCLHGQDQVRLLGLGNMLFPQLIKLHKGLESSSDNGTGASQAHLAGNVGVVLKSKVSIRKQYVMIAAILIELLTSGK